MTRQDAIAKAASDLGFWLDTDGQMYRVESNGSLSESLQLPSAHKLRRAQSYIVHLLERLDREEGNQWVSEATGGRMSNQSGTMTIPCQVAIKWDAATVCENCRTISDATGEVCPICGQRGLWSLAATLDGNRTEASCPTT